MDFETPETLLDEDIKTQFQYHKQVTESGSETDTNITDNIVKLYKLKIEEEQNRREADEKEAAREQDAFYKEQALVEQRKDRRARMIMDGIGIGVTVIFTTVGFIFEGYGSINSNTMKQVYRDALSHLKKH